MASLNPELTELELEGIKQSEDRFGEERATMARMELNKAISEAKSIIASPRLTALKNHRDKYLAHSLASTWREKKAGEPMRPVKYAYTNELFEKSITIVEPLHRWVTGKGFSIAESQKISKKCAAALWNGCTFTVEP